jgi:hypothetical protein
MAIKPSTKDGYKPELHDVVRATCLYCATKLGDFDDDIVVIGGLVPSLLIPTPPPGAELHVGTMDLDIGLTVALLDDRRYQSLLERLRSAGFKPDTNNKGNPTRQRWKSTKNALATIDFLIAPSRPDDRGGQLRNIEPDFAAIIAPGLSLAFDDRQRVRISGLTLMGETAERELWVCGPGAYVVLKALAFRLRGENKDAYDLFYVIRNFADGPSSVADRLRPLLNSRDAQQALGILREDFGASNCVGPRRVAEFLFGVPDDQTQADVTAFVVELLGSLR